MDTPREANLLLAWTTVASEAEAQSLARALVETKLAVCVQIDGPIRSVYRWNGAVSEDSEWRLLIKFLSSQSQTIEAKLKSLHPYDVPEWIVIRPEQVSEDYLAWARAGR